MYRNVHFNIISAYDYETGFPDKASADAFHQEITDLFTEAGWQVRRAKSSSANDRAFLGKSELCIHPMDICGIISEELIPEVESLIKQAANFRHNVVTIHSQKEEGRDRVVSASNLHGYRAAIYTALLLPRISSTV